MNCNDGNPCTVNLCVAGVCESAPASRDDANVCTDDSCDPDSGCVNTNNTVSCDAADPCTTDAVCSNGVCTGTSTADCAGVCNGSAVIDCAGVCGGASVTDSGGACCLPSAQDCAGICSGTSETDGAGGCCLPPAKDCAGVCSGSSNPDCAGVCNGASVEDCEGVCGGGSVTGSQGGCCLPAAQDCAGDCNSAATFDCAGVCGGDSVLDNRGKPLCCLPSQLDCNTFCFGGVVEDCADVCGGTSVIGTGGGCCQPAALDECGVCNGDGTGSVGCPGNCGGVGTCECDVCNCPERFFGGACDCLEAVANFDGFFSSFEVDNTPLTLMGPVNGLTAEAWIFMKGAGQPFFTRQGSTGPQWIWFSGRFATSLPNLQRVGFDVNQFNFAESNTAIPPNTWTHVAFTWNPADNSVLFYLNGVPDGGGTFVPIFPGGDGVLQVGRSAEFFFDGQMDEARMWSSVRIPAEIADNYDKSLTGIGTGEADLIFNHNFQKWTGGDTRAIDYSPNGLDFVSQGFPFPSGANPGLPRAPATETCPNNCNGPAGTCDCGVCTCVDIGDTTFDCEESGGGG